MKKLSLSYSKRETKEVEVEFPIYRKVVFDESVSYTRIDEDLSAVTVNIPDDLRGGRLKMEIEFEDRYNFDWSEADYHLGRGRFTSSEKEFKNAWAQLHQLVDLKCPFENHFSSNKTEVHNANLADLAG